MTASTIIQAIAKEAGLPIAAVETAARIEAPFIVGSRADLCQNLAQKLRQRVELRLTKTIATN
jgi:hypothetical protein